MDNTVLLLGFLIKLRQLNAQCFSNNGKNFCAEFMVFYIYGSVVIVVLVFVVVMLLLLLQIELNFYATAAFYILRSNSYQHSASK